MSGWRRQAARRIALRLFMASSGLPGIQNPRTLDPNKSGDDVPWNPTVVDIGADPELDENSIHHTQAVHELVLKRNDGSRDPDSYTVDWSDISGPAYNKPHVPDHIRR